MCTQMCENEREEGQIEIRVINRSCEGAERNRRGAGHIVIKGCKLKDRRPDGIMKEGGYKYKYRYL